MVWIDDKIENMGRLFKNCVDVYRPFVFKKHSFSYTIEQFYKEIS